MTQKKIYSGFIISILLGMFTGAWAQTIGVESLTSFSTKNPPSSVSVKTLAPLAIDSTTVLQEGTVITGKLVNVKDPKRLKRDANFSFEAKSYTGSDGISRKFNNGFVAKYTQPIDKGQIAEKTATSVGNFFVKGFSMGVAAVEGAVKNEDDNRLKSSVHSVYESSPVSYVEKGQDIKINTSDIFFLKFPNIKDSDSDVKDENEITEKE